MVPSKETLARKPGQCILAVMYTLVYREWLVLPYYAGLQHSKSTYTNKLKVGIIIFISKMFGPEIAHITLTLLILTDKTDERERYLYFLVVFL